MIQDSRYRIQVTRYTIQDAGCKGQDARFSIKEYTIQKAGFKL